MSRIRASGDHSKWQEEAAAASKHADDSTDESIRTFSFHLSSRLVNHAPSERAFCRQQENHKNPFRKKSWILE